MQQSNCIKERIISEFKIHKSYRCISSTLNVPVGTVGFIVKKMKESEIIENMRSGTLLKNSERNRRQMIDSDS